MGSVVIIDNADSFTFNLVDRIEALGHETVTFRNTVSNEEILARRPAALILSPGPSSPEKAGRLVEICRDLAVRIPTLGVCLGLQALVVAFGGKLGQLDLPVQGYATSVAHDGRGAFSSLPSPIPLGRYHALFALEVPNGFEISSRSEEDGVVMGIRHRSMAIEGFQFHPESILSGKYGEIILKQWLVSAGVNG